MPVKKNLAILGKWLRLNGEAIYGTSPWTTAHEGPTAIRITDTEQREREGFKASFTASDFWFTQKNDFVYAMALVVPKGGIVNVKSLNQSKAKVKSVEILGFGQVDFQQDDHGLQLKLPKKIENNSLGYALKIKLG
nr:alpha-L-fucosidase C-terminal domain-containing protein [Sphingobacterium multivorum]